MATRYGKLASNSLGFVHCVGKIVSIFDCCCRRNIMVSKALTAAPDRVECPMATEMGNATTSWSAPRRWIRFDALRYFAMGGDLVAIPSVSLLSSIAYALWDEFPSIRSTGWAWAAVRGFVCTAQPNQWDVSAAQPVASDLANVTVAVLWAVVAAFLAMVASP